MSALFFHHDNECMYLLAYDNGPAGSIRLGSVYGQPSCGSTDEFHANRMVFSESGLNSLHFTYISLLWNILHISTNNNGLGLF